MPPHRERRGVTLLELLIALAISGLAMVGGILLLDQVTDSDRRIDTASRRAATVANGDRLLRRLLLDARQPRDTVDRFRGDERNASYPTLCDTPSGWPEPCRALLSISVSGESSAVLAQTAPGARFVVRRVRGPAEFRYLDPTPAADSAWARQWMASVALPAAISLIAAGDTTVFPLGSRRD